MDSGRYISPKIQNYWRVWQAAQQVQAAEIEALRKDAEHWRHWKPWLERRVDLSKYDAAIQKEKQS